VRRERKIIKQRRYIETGWRIGIILFENPVEDNKLIGTVILRI